MQIYKNFLRSRLFKCDNNNTIHQQHNNDTLESSKRPGGLHCWRRLCHQKVTVSSCSLIPFDRIAPMGNSGTPRTSRKSPRQASTTLLQPLRFSVFPPCPFSPLPDMVFYDRPATCRLIQQSTGRDSDNPPSCVVGLSQTRPSGTGQFHFSMYYCFFR